ncbi:ribonucleotide reductase [Microcystis phage Mwe-JY26]
MTEHRFHVVSIPGCPWCSLVKQELRQRGLPFTEAKLNSEDERHVFKTSMGTKTFPQVFAGETRLGGYEDTMNWLKENGL